MEKAELTKLKRQYKAARTAYYNGEPQMTDRQFDDLEDRIRAVDPNWRELHTTGVRTEFKKTEVAHENFMPSLHKKYPHEVEKWASSPRLVNTLKGTHAFYMPKLDGTSLQLTYDGTRPVRLVTRGNGELGGDVSFMIPWLVALGRIPKRIDTTDRTSFRCEALMKSKVFATRWASQFDNSRNMVNGLFNRQDQHRALADVDIVVLGVYGWAYRAGLHEARSRWGFTTVKNESIIPMDLNGETLTKILERTRKQSEYELDGLVLADGEAIFEYKTNEKPKYLPHAFKVNDIEGAAEVRLLKEIWQKTRTGRWQPVFEIPPTKMEGAVVTRVTGNNPAWLQARGVGVGAVVKVLRSGGVIPKIVGVIKKSKLKGPPGPYVVKGSYWMIADESDATVRVRSTLHFLTTLGVENIALKTVIKLHDCGLLKTPLDYVKWGTQEQVKRRRRLMTKADLGPRQAEIIDQQITDNLTGKTVALRTLMVASGFFDGIGDRRLAMIEDEGISLQSLIDNSGSPSKIAMMVDGVRGFGSKMTKALASALLEFSSWLDQVQTYMVIERTLKKKTRSLGGPLKGVGVTWTGYRSAEQEQLVTSLGGEVIKGLSSRTTVLLYSESGKTSSKVQKAGSKAMTWATFTSKYSISNKN